MVGGRDGEAPTIVDERIDTIKDLTLKSLRLKPDKWDRMYISDEQRHFINNFVDKDQPIVKTFAYNFNRHIMTGPKCFVHPIFLSFVFWYFGHFSYVIFFLFFFCLAHLAFQNVNKDYLIFSYFHNFVAKSDQK